MIIPDRFVHVTIQHEVEICRSEQPFVIQSQSAAESFTSADSHHGLSLTADDRPLTPDTEQPGPLGLSAQPATDVAGASVIDTSDIIIKTAPPSKSMMCCFLLSAVGNSQLDYFTIHFGWYYVNFIWCTCH